MGVGSAWLRQSLLRAGIVRRNPVTLSAGGVSDVYFDVKRAYGVPLLLTGIAQEIGHYIPRGTIVAGSGYGGAPLAAALCPFGG